MRDAKINGLIVGCALDHVALATERWADAWPCYAAGLGGRWVWGSHRPGAAPCQLSYANGMRIEILAPHAVELDDFLLRFLGRHGRGPHHLTFTVPDLRAALVELEGGGVDPVGVDLSDPEWKEAFLRPAQAAGVVVQLAQSTGDAWPTPSPEDLPVHPAAPASFSYVCHAVASLEQALELFGDMLGGEEQARGEDDGARWVDLAWPGPGRMRLLEPATTDGALAKWLGGRPGRVHHLGFACPEPARLPGVIPLAGGQYEVPLQHAVGVRLLVTTSAES